MNPLRQLPWHHACMPQGMKWVYSAPKGCREHTSHLTASNSALPALYCLCRWIQGLPEALAHWPVPECVRDCQVLGGRLPRPEALRPAGVQRRPDPGESTEDHQETVHSEQTLPQTTSHQSAQREVAHWNTKHGKQTKQGRHILSLLGVLAAAFALIH